MYITHPPSPEKQAMQQVSYLGDDLIYQEILTKLPIKSIVRFESVSKQWYSTLSSPSFAISYLKKSAFSHPSAPVQTLFIKSGMNYYLFPYDEHLISDNFEDDLVKLDLDFDVGDDYLGLTGCCNGLICLTCSAKYFLLWNPATRKLHRYELPSIVKSFVMPFGQLRGFVACGFGYASSLNDYKFVSVSTCQEKEDRVIVHVFSLREKCWRKIDVGLNIIWFIHGQAVQLNDTLYWAAYSRQAGQVIASFDLLLEQFDMFPTPKSGTLQLLGVMGDCLCRCTCDDMLMELLQPPTVVTKSVTLPKGLGLESSSEMVGVTSTGKFFVMSSLFVSVWDFRRRVLWLVDPSTEPMQYSMLLRFEGPISIARYVPSLVSPFATAGLPEP